MKSYIGKITQMDGNENFIGIRCPTGINGAVLGQLVIIVPLDKKDIEENNIVESSRLSELED